MTLSSDEESQLSEHQSAAALYYEDGKLDQAMDQVERGLDIDPDNYKLNALKGMVLLRASTTNNALLAESLEVLERVYSWRSALRHEPYVLLSLGLARQSVGLGHLGASISLANQARRAGEHKAELRQQAKAEREQANEFLKSADLVLNHLIERGELLRITHNHLMQIRSQLGDDDGFERSAKSFFEESKKALTVVEAEIERTEAARYEDEKLRERSLLIQEEIDVRALYSNWLFERERYDESLVQIDRVLELDPRRPYDYYNRGTILLELDRQEEAQSDFRMFLSMTNLPDDNRKKTFAVRALRQ